MPYIRSDNLNHRVAERNASNVAQSRAHINAGLIAALIKRQAVAGTGYSLTFYQGGYQTGVDVRPRLCNVRGIPFGYAVVEVVGSYVWHRNGISGTPSVHVVDAPCPVDPPR